MKNKKLLIACIGISLIYWIAYSFFMTQYSGYESGTYDTSNDITLTLYSAVATIDEESEMISLPYTFTDLEERTEVTISAQFNNPGGGYFYIETAYTPVTVYINGEVVYTYGEDGTFPSLLVDSALNGQIIPLNSTDEIVELKILYESPITTDSFTVNTVLFGTQESLYNSLFESMGFSIVFGGMLIITGIFIICIVLIVMIFEKRSITFLWLGFALLTSGLWLLCDSPLFGVFIDNPSRLSMMALYGMIIFPMTLLYFSLTTIRFYNPRPVLWTGFAYMVLALLSLLLQLTSMLSAYQVKTVFNIVVPLSVSAFSIFLIYESYKHKNKMAQRFSFPSLVLASLTVLDFFNYNRNFAMIYISFFQIGIIIFMVSMGVMGGFFIRDALELRSNTQKMELDMKMMAYQASTLKGQSELILETGDTLRKQRHDLRHQLTVIRELATQDTNEQLLSYLDTITTNIPNKQIYYCNNVTINAILSRYADICEKGGIVLDIDLVIPSFSSDALDSDYCVIFGNLLENALEACHYVTDDKKFIQLKSKVRYNTLIISMQNSFDGHISKRHGKFRSRKRNEYGIGLTSIQSTARKYNGDASFHGEDLVFHSAVYMNPEE